MELEKIQNTLNSLRRSKQDGIFDSHDFINEYRSLYEADYVSELSEHSSEISNDAFRKENASIARCLSNYSATLNIEKVDSNHTSKNDHGKETQNMLWRFLPIMIFFVTIFLPIGASAQTNSKLFKELSVEPYTVEYQIDSLYWVERMLALKELNGKIINKKAKSAYTILNAVSNMADKMKKKPAFSSEFEERIYNYLNSCGLEDRVSGLQKIQRIYEDLPLRYGMTEDSYSNEDSLRVFYEGLRLESNNSLRSVEPYFTKQLNDSRIIDTIPYKKIKVKGSFLPLKEYLEPIRKKDMSELRKGYEWAFEAMPDVSRRSLSYPIEITYYTHKTHPNYAILPDYIDSWHKDGARYIYDLDGNIKYVIIKDFLYITLASDLWKHFPLAQQEIIKQYYKSNRYNIQAEDEITKKFVEMNLSGQMDSLRMNLFGETVALTLASGLNELATGESSVLYFLENMNEQETYKYLKEIKEQNKEQWDKAGRYVAQLRKDCEQELYIGRIRRVTETSFYISFLKKDGTAVMIEKIEYLQDGPFKYKKEFSFLWP